MMKQYWTISPHDSDTPTHISEAIMEHGRNMELSNDSHFFLDIRWQDPEDVSEAVKILAKYVEEELKLDPDDVLFFYWW